MDLPIQLQKEGGMPLYAQLQDQLRLLIKQGRLQAGDSMPTVREMAVALELNSNTVARVYRDLQREGWLVLRRGIGTFVAEDALAEPLAKRDLRGLEQKTRELITMAQHLDISPAELFQMIETRWKEQSHAQR